MAYTHTLTHTHPTHTLRLAVEELPSNVNHYTHKKKEKKVNH